jgi:hypothetical protein
MFGRRPDATLVRDAPPVRRFMPFISPRRGESLVYFEQDVSVESALAFVEARNQERSDAPPLTLFHLVLRAIVLTLADRPRLNRFTAGGRLWQRDGIWITFSAKLRFDDDAPILTVKRRLDPTHSLDAMVEAIHSGLESGRSGKKTTADQEVGILLRLPPSLTRLLMWGVDRVDSLGLLPRAMIEGDPMFSSVFVANLGSVGLEAGYHHLWEHGTCPIFCVIGRIKPGAAGDRVVTLKWSYDERIEDGLYCARGLEGLRELVEHPEELVKGRAPTGGAG